MRTIIWFGPWAVLLLAGLGCGDDFSPASYLDDLRVLAIEADPLEAGPGERVRLVPRIWAPADVDIAEQSWAFCPFHLGSARAYACAAPGCERGVEPDPDGRIEAEPFAWAMECAEQAGGGDFLPEQLPEKVDVLFTYTVSDSSGFSRRAVLSYPVYTSELPESRNTAPRIAWLSLAGVALEPGEAIEPVGPEEVVAIRVQVDESSLDSYVDEAGEERVEEPIVSFYTTAGRLDYDRDAGVLSANTFKAVELLPDQEAAEIYVVIRDLRGGQSLSGPYVIPLDR
ncbi:MAG: hypothetical protein JXR96_30290 [Deltaproteobacteria bacterium]|nr:hypothetical protein [Deltaproteobacteria bacterium]